MPFWRVVGVTALLSKNQSSSSEMAHVEDREGKAIYNREITREKCCACCWFSRIGTREGERRRRDSTSVAESERQKKKKLKGDAMMGSAMPVRGGKGSVKRENCSFSEEQGCQEKCDLLVKGSLIIGTAIWLRRLAGGTK